MRAPVNMTGVRVLRISSNPDDSLDYSSLPTDENLLTGDYPLRLRFKICYNHTKRAQIENLLKRFFEAPTSAALLKNGFIPLPSREREAIVLELDIGS